MYTICPKCFSEDVYFNGVCYVCPDCDYEWHNNGSESLYDEEDDE